jgi:hypothetical protein
MNGPQRFNDKARQVAETARAFTIALERGPADQAVAVDDLEQAARGWAVQAESMQGFRGDDEYGEAFVSLEDRVAAVATDLGVAEVLLAAGIAAEEVEADVDGRKMLRSSVSRLEADLASQRVAADATVGFTRQSGGTEPSGAPRAQLAEVSGDTVDGVVEGTLMVLQEAWARLRELMPDVAGKALGAMEAILDAAPQVGRLVRLGLQTVKRALLALFELMPDQLKAAARAEARKWWGDDSDGVEQVAVARLIAAQRVRLTLQNLNLASVDPERLERASALLRELATRFERVSQAFRRVMQALAAAVAVAAFVAVVVAVGSWLPLAAAVGYLLAAGSVILVARDYLDTGGLLSRVDGVQQILSDLATK